MSRPLSALIVGLAVAGAASAQCSPWYPVYPVYPVIPSGYPLSPAVWGAPAPKPLPPLAAPKVAPKETTEEVPLPAKSKTPAKDAGRSSDGPRIPKTKLPVLPGDPVDKAIPDAPKSDSPKSDGPKKDRVEGKPYEQYVVPAYGRGEQKAEV